MTSVLELIGAVLETFEVGGFVALTLADLSNEAFNNCDCVSYRQLLGKLQSYGIDRAALQIF